MLSIIGVGIQTANPGNALDGVVPRLYCYSAVSDCWPWAARSLFRVRVDVGSAMVINAVISGVCSIRR